jgi:alpha-tubulin suppressor-like RCC1 family protein
VPSGLVGVTAIAAGTGQSLALKSDGTVVAWGCGGGSDTGQCRVPMGLSGVTAISAGYSHSLALKGDGTVVAWGCGGGLDSGQCTVLSGLSGVTAISAGGLHSLALKGDGTVVAWGCRLDFGQCSVPSGLSGVTAISAGGAHNLALKSDGAVVAWGCGGGSDDGQCKVPSGLSGVTAIAAAVSRSIQGGFGSHSMALIAVATPARCRVPNVVGKRLASAKRTIARRHCRTGKVGYAYSSKRKKGIVVSQSRRPAKVLPARARINLVVSRGREHL